MSKKKREYDIEIEEVGHNCVGVTGSCTILTYYDEEKQERRKIMLELGLVQKEQDPYKLYLDNSKMLQSITKEVISCTDYVILSHSHV